MGTTNGERERREREKGEIEDGWKIKEVLNP
jgi:hypothetical protein